MPTQPSEEAVRLGELLIRRRIELDPRYRNRRTFEAERAPGLYRILNGLERGQWRNYEPGTKGAIESAYALAPGSLDRTAAGGPLEPQEARHPDAAEEAREERPATLAAAPDPRDRNSADDLNGDPALRPYIQSVLRDIYTAAGIMPRLGPGQELPGVEATPEIMQLFAQIPGSQVFRLEHEAKTWDTDLIDAPAKVRAIARWRRLAAEYEDRARNAMLGRP